MNKKLVSVLSGVILLAGVSLMLYPAVSNFWNSFHQSRAIAAYTSQVSELEDDSYNLMWEEARSYNQRLVMESGMFLLNESEKQIYNHLLNPGGNGVMGYIEIPKIDVTLPIYHGTDESVLQIAAGHVEWSSLPVGGESTHCVLSGHRGLPSSKLFTDLDQLKKGDLIILKILDEKLTYEIDQITVVEPDEISPLMIEEGKDLCTLITCTPYGINTHRLLVRGQRIDSQTDTQVVRVTTDTVKVDIPLLPPLLIIAALVIICAVVKSAGYRNRKKTKK